MESRWLVADNAGMPGPDFSRIEWQGNALQLSGLRFAFIGGFDVMRDQRALSGEIPTFLVFKVPWFIRQYEEFWTGTPRFLPKRIVELGGFLGGSAVFWTELLRPEKLVVIDSASSTKFGRKNSEKLRAYDTSRNLEQRLKFYWETDQSDAPVLRDIVQRECGGTLDLVIDDASHLYATTKRSFEILFPRLRWLGWYVIEDWNHDELRPDRASPPLSSLVVELVNLAARQPGLIRTVRLVHGLAFFERGHAKLDDTFRINDYV